MKEQNVSDKMKSGAENAGSVRQPCDHHVRVSREPGFVEASDEPPGKPGNCEMKNSRGRTDSDSDEEAGATVDIAGLPHYSPQSPIYSLLLSALSLSEHYERLPGAQERQAKLESLLKKYQKTCDTLNEETF